MLRERGTGRSEDGGTARCSLLLLLKEGHHRRAQGVPPGQEAASWGLGSGLRAPFLALPPAPVRVDVGTSSQGQEGALSQTVEQPGMGRAL